MCSNIYKRTYFERCSFLLSLPDSVVLTVGSMCTLSLLKHANLIPAETVHTMQRQMARRSSSLESGSSLVQAYYHPPLLLYTGANATELLVPR